MPRHRGRHGEIGVNGAQNGSSLLDHRMQVGLEFIAFRLEGGELRITAGSASSRRFKTLSRILEERKGDRSREKRGVSVGASTWKREEA